MAKEHNYEHEDSSMQEDQPKEELKQSDVHGRFRENISSISFSKQKNKASADISFSLDVKKVLILTIAE